MSKPGRAARVDGDPAAGLLGEQASNIKRPAGLVGYDDAGDLISEDEETDA